MEHGTPFPVYMYGMSERMQGVPNRRGIRAETRPEVLARLTRPRTYVWMDGFAMPGSTGREIRKPAGIYLLFSLVVYTMSWLLEVR
jgi:hypothetical protein